MIDKEKTLSWINNLRFNDNIFKTKIYSVFNKLFLYLPNKKIEKKIGLEINILINICEDTNYIEEYKKIDITHLFILKNILYPLGFRLLSLDDFFNEYLEYYSSTPALNALSAKEKILTYYLLEKEITPPEVASLLDLNSTEITEFLYYLLLHDFPYASRERNRISTILTSWMIRFYQTRNITSGNLAIRVIYKHNFENDSKQIKYGKEFIYQQIRHDGAFGYLEKERRIAGISLNEWLNFLTADCLLTLYEIKEKDYNHFNKLTLRKKEDSI